MAVLSACDFALQVYSTSLPDKERGIRGKVDKQLQHVTGVVFLTVCRGDGDIVGVLARAYQLLLIGAHR